MTIPIALLIFLFIFLLMWGSNMVVIGLRRIANATHTGVFILSAVMLSLATSLPELFIALTSGINQSSTLSLGNVFGANITNLTFVAGGAAIIAGSARVAGIILKKEVFMALIAGLLPIGLLVDGTLSRVDGFILIVLWGVFTAHFFRIRFFQIARHFQEEGFWYRFIHRHYFTNTTGKETARLLLGVAVMLFASDMIVRLARALTDASDIPLVVVGAIIVALGTTLPEFAFSLRSLFAGESSMFLGNLIGSVIVNATLVLGVAGALAPVTLTLSKTMQFGWAFLIVFGLFWFFIHSKYRLERWEASVLLVVYILFVLILTV